MKKRLMMLVLMGCLAFAGCSSENKDKADADKTTESGSGTGDGETSILDDVEAPEDATEEPEEVKKDNTPITKDTIEDKGIDAFMTLGDYKGLELTRTIYTVTDEDVETEITTQLNNFPMELTDAEATVAEGDVVNLKYEGKVDGVAFDGGSADSDNLTIGSGRFIDDFEDQLIGWKSGETGEVNVTFPEDYGKEELNGKDAVFTVTINKISRALTEPTVEWLTANTDYTTVEDFRAGVKTELETNNTNTTNSTLQDEAWQTVFATASFTQYPQNVLDECLEQQNTTYESYAQMYGMEYDAFLEASGITEDDLTEAAKNTVQNVLTLNYICDKEGITEESESYQNKLTELLQASGLADKAAALEQGITEWNIDFVVRYNCVMDVILTNANITDTQATE